VSLRLAGSEGDTTYVEMLRKTIDAQGLRDRVHFLGLLDHERLLAEFKEAAMLVLPSYQETAPMVVQQAMAAKVPVVATNVCGIPDQLENGRCGLLFEPGDVETMSRHISFMLSAKKQRDEMVQAAFAKARAEFDVEIVATATVDFYEEVRREER
jgi:glycosyltransferase involved in cell wall biosynthesis